MVVDVVVVVSAAGQDGNLHLSELVRAGPVLTEVFPPGSNAGVTGARGHAGDPWQTDLLHSPVDVERPVELDQGDVVPELEIVVAGGQEDLLQVVLLLPGTLTLPADHPSAVFRLGARMVQSSSSLPVRQSAAPSQRCPHHRQPRPLLPP